MLQMVLESDTKQCASKGAGPKGVGYGEQNIPYKGVETSFLQVHSRV